MNKKKLLSKVKIIQDPIHGTVSITLLAKYFIDNIFFQKLRGLKQLGTCYMIFPSATHTRFEHSIGTYHLADKLLTRIKLTSNPDNMMIWMSKIENLQDYFKSLDDGVPVFDDFVIELIKICALCHDIGHGPYSHAFDDSFLKNSSYANHSNASHETRSCLILELIIKSNPILSEHISNNMIAFMKSVIDPSDDNVGFVWEIVSNNRNGLDVDKYDYITRDSHHLGFANGFDYSRLVDNVLVIDNKIVYQEQSFHDIYQLYITRYFLHKKVYSHKGVLSAQHLITDIMEILDDILGIRKSITDMNLFVKMTDNFVDQYTDFVLDKYILTSVSLTVRTSNNIIDKTFSFDDNSNLTGLNKDKLDKLADLSNRLKSHDLYQFIGFVVTDYTDCIAKFKKEFDKDIYIVHVTKTGFVSGNKPNPLDNIYVYKTKDVFNHGDMIEAVQLKKDNMTHILPSKHQEYIIMVFRRDKNDDEQDIEDDKIRFNDFVKSNVKDYTS